MQTTWAAQGHTTQTFAPLNFHFLFINKPYTQCSVSHGHGPNLGGGAGSKVPLMILYRVRCPWCQKRWWWGAPDLFLPGTVPLRISDCNFCLKYVPWSDSAFFGCFRIRILSPIYSDTLITPSWHSNVLKTPKMYKEQWKDHPRPQNWRRQYNCAVHLFDFSTLCIFIWSFKAVA